MPDKIQVGRHMEKIAFNQHLRMSQHMEKLALSEHQQVQARYNLQKTFQSLQQMSVTCNNKVSSYNYNHTKSDKSITNKLYTMD